VGYGEREVGLDDVVVQISGFLLDKSRLCSTFYSSICYWELAFSFVSDLISIVIVVFPTPL